VAQTVEQALQKARLIVDEQPYLYLKLPAQAITLAAGMVAEVGEPFCALVVDEHEVTVIIPDDALPDFKNRLRDHEVNPTIYRLLTFDVALEPELVGFMAQVSAALATAGVPVFPFAAYTRDHVLVPADRLDAAVAALRQLGAQA
jgi:hypothetical protein